MKPIYQLESYTDEEQEFEFVTTGKLSELLEKAESDPCYLRVVRVTLDRNQQEIRKVLS